MHARGGDFRSNIVAEKFKGRLPEVDARGGKFFDEILLRRISREGSCVGDPVEK